MAYLWSSVAWVSMPGDAVHFTNLAFGESPHSTVPFSSGEAICNNTPGIEKMEREEIPAVASSGKKKKKGEKNPHTETWPEGAWTQRAFTASHLPEPGGRCHTDPQNAVRAQWEHYERVQSAQPSVRQILWANFLAVYVGVQLRGTKECLRETCEVLQLGLGRCALGWSLGDKNLLWAFIQYVRLTALYNISKLLIIGCKKYTTQDTRYLVMMF